MKKQILIILSILFINSCGFLDYDDNIIDIHNKKRDGWSWITWKGNEIIVKDYDTAKGEWGKYCPLTGADTCMFQESKDMFYIEVNIEKHDYDKAIKHFKKHIQLWEKLNPVSIHHRIMDTCKFECDEKHAFRTY